MNFHIYGSLFDISHITYIVISLGLTVLFLWLPSKVFTTQTHKDVYLKFWGWATIFLHISPLWIEFLKGNQAVAADNMLFPIYFCNLSMYLLVIVAIWGNKKSKAFNYLATMTGYAGALGALISLFYPEYYIHGGSIFDWGVFKSMLSHSTMLVGSLYLMVGGYFKIQKQNTVVYFVGLLVFGLIGIGVNQTFALAGLNAPNAMFLQRPPIEDVPFLNVYVIALMMVTLIFGFTTLVEHLRTKRLLQTAPLVATDNN
ncbi:MAG TPA: YwaF family protein [Bacilli bacterium]|nr:YwaF family protein [Bacilli bacterium]